MADIHVFCPQCKERVATISPCPECGYRSLRGVPEPIVIPARWTVRLLFLQALAGLSATSIFYAVVEEAGKVGVLRAVEEAWEITQVAVYFIALIWFMATVLFLSWQYRLRLNYDRLGVSGMIHSPKQGVKYWLIPIVQLFKPYPVLQELWRAGATGATEETRRGAWRKSPSSMLVRLYWMTYVFTFILWVAVILALHGVFGGGFRSREAAASRFLVLLGVYQGGHLLARIMEVFIVERFTRRQEALRKRQTVPAPREDQEAALDAR